MGGGGGVFLFFLKAHAGSKHKLAHGDYLHTGLDTQEQIPGKVNLSTLSVIRPSKQHIAG